MAKGTRVDGPLPPLLRTYHIMKAFPGLTPEQIGEVPAIDWDWLLAIEAEVNRAKGEVTE